MSERIDLIVDRVGERLDRYVAAECPQLSRSHVQRLIEDGNVTVNGTPAKSGHKLKEGDMVAVVVPPPTSIELEPEDIPLSIVYEDDDVLVIDKPAGLTVHPAPGHSEHTLVNAILAHCHDLSINGSIRPGIVHRLDKDTSGVMMIAKNDSAQRDLSEQIRSRFVLKQYTVLVHGRLSPEKGVIEAPIGRDPSHRKRMAVVASGREARTHYRVTKYFEGYTLLEVTLETGRTHQIRVHLSATGFPVAGDSIYGKGLSIMGRQFVHASRLGFRLPSSGEWVEFESPLPRDLEEAVEHLAKP
ncbi:MAG: RluA family pseudouridine synthase [Chloroflexota bacterium]|nr:RluA family pseudouridine synthase [Chloroflexota bacterium]